MGASDPVAIQRGHKIVVAIALVHVLVLDTMDRSADLGDVIVQLSKIRKRVSIAI